MSLFYLPFFLKFVAEKKFGYSVRKFVKIPYYNFKLEESFIEKTWLNVKKKSTLDAILNKYKTSNYKYSIELIAIGFHETFCM